MSLANKGFPIPDGVIEVTDEHSLDLVHFEFKNMKPKGTILFKMEKSEIPFQFFADETREGWIYARPVQPNSVRLRDITESLDTYERFEGMVTVTLMQFRIIFLCSRFQSHYQNGQRFLKMLFPDRILKMHRRKFIRIPFNERFPAELKFQTDKGMVTRKLKDLSREGMKIQLEPGDTEFMAAGYRPKQAVLKVLNREMPLGLNVMAVHGTVSAGLKIVAISEEDKLWIKDAIRVLMGQILGLDISKVDDQLEKDDSSSNKT
jgi:hypothetical protein